MMRKQIFRTALLGILVAICFSVSAQKTFVVDYTLLVNNKQKGASDTKAKSAINKLLKEADKALLLKNLSVVYKPMLPPSGDKHDYLSLATYWWPNPLTKDGLPYIPKDGQANPARLKIKDLSYITQLSKGIKTLGLAYFFSGNKQYAAKVEELLNVWFINSKTKMNPNLNYAGAILGVPKKRGEGVIDSRYFVDLIDGVQLVKTAIAESTYKGTVAWFVAYDRWLDTSEVGEKAKQLENNIATAYLMQRLTYLRMAGKDNSAKILLNNSVKRLINIQFDKDGSQLLENKRTKSWSYNTANLKYWFNIAKIGDDLGIDIWNYNASSNKSIRGGYTYLEKYATGKQKWENKQITPVDFQQSFFSLHEIGKNKYKTTNQASARSSTSQTKLSINDPVILLTETKF